MPAGRGARHPATVHSPRQWRRSGASPALEPSTSHVLAAGTVTPPPRRGIVAGKRIRLIPIENPLMAKSATKKKPPRQPDLFDLPKRAAARRRRKSRARKPTQRKAPKASARKATRAASAESGYTAKHIEVLEGLGARAPPPRHVYRRHRREGAASSVRRGDRQFHGRGAGRPRRLDRSRDGGQRLRLRHRQRPRHSGRSASQVQEQVGAGSDHVHAARRRQIRFQGLRDLAAACTASASRSPTRCPSAWRSRSRASRRSTAWRSSAASRRASWKKSAARPTGAAPKFVSGPIRKSSDPRPPSRPSACSR